MELRASPPNPGACLPHLPSGAQVDEGCYEAMTPEYLAKLLTPFPLPTKDGWMLRTIGDTGAYILALPKKRKGLAHWEDAQADCERSWCGHSDAAGAQCTIEG